MIRFVIQLTKARTMMALATSVIIAGGAVAVAHPSTALAATPTCNWVAAYAGAWVPEYLATNTVNCNMVQGDESAGVRQLQHTMNLCYSEHLDEDGNFGRLTHDALVRTQRKAGTPADGEYGPNTRKAMVHEPINGGPCIHVP